MDPSDDSARKGALTGRLSRRAFAGAAVGMAGWAAWRTLAGRTPAVSNAPHRNIVMIITDDQRFDALGFLGHPFLKTPNIDALARNGAYARNSFVTTSLCSPSRASMLTGQYAHKHGILDNQTILPRSTPIYPELLQAAGYETAYVGKWHMGGSTDEPRPGWSYWASFAGQGEYLDPLFNINGSAKQFSGYTTDIISDVAVDWLRDRRDTPFCLAIGHKAVHNPFKPAPRHQSLYEGAPVPRPMPDDDAAYANTPDWVHRQRRSYHGVDGIDGKGLWDGQFKDFDAFYYDYMRTIVAVDEGVGRIVEELTKQGQLESTFFVFTSDNGFMLGEHGLLDKRCMYEESIRIPLVVHCPELIKPGSTFDEMVLNIDYAPTLLDVAGLAAPPTMQGTSFLPLLRGEQIAWRDSFLYEYFFEPSYPMTPTVLGVRTKKWKYMEFQGIWDAKENFALYDLEHDSGENTNLADHHETKAIQAQLSKELGVLLKRFDARRAPSWKA